MWRRTAGIIITNLSSFVIRGQKTWKEVSEEWGVKREEGKEDQEGLLDSFYIDTHTHS